MSAESTPSRRLRWGILGTGWIASEFVQDLRLVEGRSIGVAAVGSRRPETAAQFAETWGITTAHGSYEDLVADPDVDVVYIAVPHPEHHRATRLAIEAGKHVLVEKPFMLNAAEARDVVALAAERNVFVMEAMWTRFLPGFRELRTLLDEHALGDLVAVIADHGQWFEKDAKFRLFAPELGGGALLDLGVYVVSFASFVLGAPSTVIGVGTPAFTGVDASTSMMLTYSGGQHALLQTTSAADGANRALIIGTEARIEIDPFFYRPGAFTVVPREGKAVRHDHFEPGFGLRFQVLEVERCIAEGLIESSTMPLAESVEIMETMDEVRRQIGVVYPQERRSDNAAPQITSE